MRVKYSKEGLQKAYEFAAQLRYNLGALWIVEFYHERGKSWCFVIHSIEKNKRTLTLIHERLLEKEAANSLSGEVWKSFYNRK